MYSSLDVHNRLQELDVPHELFKLSGQAGSFQSAAAGLGLEPGQTARVELFRLDSEPVMVIVPGDREVDESKLMSISGASSVSRVPSDEIPSLTGFLAGSLPPVAHKVQMPAYIDYYALKEDVVYTCSGEPTAILKIRSYDLVRATGGETVDLVLSTEGARDS
jgi:prolyl-tRNA editing enzyme YbaK/EbsC (Cys-tRNA(Pro) deacylase)